MDSLQTPFTVCQSCGMPMQKPEDHGTNSDKSQNQDYCCYCYQDGDFTTKIDLDQFTKMQIKIATEKLGMTEEQAQKMAEETLPKLKRWQS